MTAPKARVLPASESPTSLAMPPGLELPFARAVRAMARRLGEPESDVRRVAELAVLQRGIASVLAEEGI